MTPAESPVEWACLLDHDPEIVIGPQVSDVPTVVVLFDRHVFFALTFETFRKVGCCDARLSVTPELAPNCDFPEIPWSNSRNLAIEMLKPPLRPFGMERPLFCCPRRALSCPPER